MAPRKTRAIDIFANSACVVLLTLRKSDRPLFPKADVQITRKLQIRQAANGQKRSLTAANSEICRVASRSDKGRTIRRDQLSLLEFVGRSQKSFLNFQPPKDNAAKPIIAGIITPIHIHVLGFEISETFVKESSAYIVKTTPIATIYDPSKGFLLKALSI